MSRSNDSEHVWNYPDNRDNRDDSENRANRPGPVSGHTLANPQSLARFERLEIRYSIFDIRYSSVPMTGSRAISAWQRWIRSKTAVARQTLTDEALTDEALTDEALTDEALTERGIDRTRH